MAKRRVMMTDEETRVSAAVRAVLLEGLEKPGEQLTADMARQRTVGVLFAIDQLIPAIVFDPPSVEARMIDVMSNLLDRLTEVANGNPAVMLKVLVNLALMVAIESSPEHARPSAPDGEKVH